MTELLDTGSVRGIVVSDDERKRRRQIIDIRDASRPDWTGGLDDRQATVGQVHRGTDAVIAALDVEGEGK